MRNRFLLLIGVVEALLVLAAVYYEPTCCVRGHLRGEAFYDHKPTSWWRHELEQWEVDAIWVDSLGAKVQGANLFYRCERHFTWLDRLIAGQWQFWKAEPEIALWVLPDFQGPALIRGQPEAELVLRELLNDPSPKIRRFARIGLKMEPETPREE